MTKRIGKIELTKSKLKQIIKEELRNVLNEANEESLRLAINKVFCVMGTCVSIMRVLDAADAHSQVPGLTVQHRVKAADKTPEAMAKAKKEAYDFAYALITKKLAAKGLDIKKIKVHGPRKK